MWTTREGPIFDHFPVRGMCDDHDLPGRATRTWRLKGDWVDLGEAKSGSPDLRRSRITWFDWDHFFFSVVHNVNLACSSHIQLFDLQRAHGFWQKSWRKNQRNIAALPVKFGIASSPAWLRSATIHVLCDETRFFRPKKTSFGRSHATPKVKVQLSHSCKS